ncbi:MAG: AAA family ATPase [Desulfovibrio sp.]|nr:AAA family ATPase [Desulfovibrio sp.]
MQIDTHALQLTEEQAKALSLLQTGRNVFLTGKAGTGKSVLIQFFRAWAQSQHRLVAVCAPTGFAARNVDGVTMHRFVRLPPQPVEPFRSSKVALRESSAFYKAEIIIIDEISMCRADYFQYFYNTLMQIKRRKQVVVVGDFFQLPPVMTDNDRKALEKTWGARWKSEYAFDTEAWKKLDFLVIRLETILRQNPSQTQFIQSLNAIRNYDFRALNWINANAHKEKREDVLEICPRNVTVNEINYARLAKLKGPEYEITGEVTGDYPEQDMPAERVMRLRSGARVMTVANDLESRFINGDLGYVYFTGKGGQDTGQIQVVFDNGNKVWFREKPDEELLRFKWSNNEYAVGDEEIEREVEREVFEEIDGKLVPKIVKKQETATVKSLQLKEIGSFLQLPLKLAYAITIHKSQGQTFQKAVVHSGMFASGQLYTALSRLASINGLYLHEPLRNFDLRTSERVREFERTCKPVDLKTVSVEALTLPIPKAVQATDWGALGIDEEALLLAKCKAEALGHSLDELIAMIIRRLAHGGPEVTSSLFAFLGIESKKKSSASDESQETEEKLELLAYIHDNCINSLLAAQSWPELHKVCSQWGLQIRERGGGFVFVAKKNGVMVKASSIHRQLSGKHLVDRIGSFCPAK